MKLRFLIAHAGNLFFFEGKLLFLPEQTASFLLRHCAFLFALLLVQGPGRVFCLAQDILHRTFCGALLLVLLCSPGEPAPPSHILSG